MLKVLGCIIIFTGCCGLGLLKASSYKRRRVELENSMELLKLMNMEISYKKDPLIKTFCHVASMKPCWFADLLMCCCKDLKQQRPLQEAWKNAMGEMKTGCPLHKEDLTILEDLALGLGKSDTDGQNRLFQPAMMRLESKLRQAAEEESRQGRMYKGLGAGAGIIIVIILI